MTDRLSLPRLPRLLLPLLAAFLLSCLFDKEKEDVELRLDNLPSGVDNVEVWAVDRNDTGSNFALLYDGAWTAGETKKFSLGAAQGKDWALRVVGNQDGYVVYLSIVPSGKNASDLALHVDVSSGWPMVAFKSARRDSDSVRLAVEYRNAPSGTHWHLNLGAISMVTGNYVISHNPDLSVHVARVTPVVLLIADLHDGSHDPLPVQLSDTILAQEVLAPAGSGVRIDSAYRATDSVHLVLAFQNFQSPLVDEPTPGRGLAMAYDMKGMRLLPSFVAPFGGSNRLVGSAAELIGVDTVVVALHYANGMRIRPLIADSVAQATALLPRNASPSVRILSHDTVGAVLRLTLERNNYQGLHNHISKNDLNSLTYQICDTDVCDLDSTVWRGASKLVVSAHIDNSHALRMPAIVDSVSLP